MSNSSLVEYVKLSPNCSKPRLHKIDTITIHHMAGNLSVETCGNFFAPTSRQASSNYGIGSDGRVGMYVEEKNRSWCTSSKSNDHRAITIEVANDKIGGDWHVSDKALSKLIELCVDICKRNGIKKLNYTGDTKGNLTMHKWFANTNCPGPYLESKFEYIADEVNKQLSPEKKTGKKYNGLFPTLPKVKNNKGVMVAGSLKKGSKGTQVKRLQKFLNWYGDYNLVVDGDFGTKTESAVKKFQKDMKIEVDGYFGKDSLAKAKAVKK